MVMIIDDNKGNDTFITDIKPSLNEKVDIAFVVEQQKHLSMEQKLKPLLAVLTSHKVLFRDKLGT
jgi:hypothetical protein